MDNVTVYPGDRATFSCQVSKTIFLKRFHRFGQVKRRLTRNEIDRNHGTSTIIHIIPKYLRLGELGDANFGMLKLG